jgi:hypothetical protein
MTPHPAFTVTFLSPCRCTPTTRNDRCPVPAHRVPDDESNDL